jgi:tRNA-2-methylthio-N6-dimethylallyladenosine synthase
MTDDVPEEVKGERLERVIELQERISAQINARMVGQSVEVLVEGPSRRAIDGKRNYYGRSPQGKTVIFPQEAEPNQFVHVSINSTTSHTLFGDVVAVGRPSTEGKVIART